MKNSFLLILSVSVLILCATGCGDKISVHGKVTFSDGKPLDIGSVIFQGNGVVSRGLIQSDGTFRISTLKANDGVAPGNYKVYISGAVRGEADPNAKHDPDGGTSDEKIIPLIDVRFANPDTSELVCEVKRGMKLPQEIKVDYPTNQGQ